MLQRWQCHCIVWSTNHSSIPHGLWSLNPNLIHQPPMYMGFQADFIHHSARTASKALTCNQSSVCLCQVNSANFQLKKNWVLGLIFGGVCQEASSGVFLSMGRNAFSSPVKDYSKSLSHNTHPSALLSRRAIVGDNRQMEGWKKWNVK